MTAASDKPVSLARTSMLSKYALVFGLLLLGALMVSCLTGLYFSYSESRAATLRLERERATAVADGIFQYVSGIEQHLSTTGRINPGGNDAAKTHSRAGISGAIFNCHHGRIVGQAGERAI